MGLAGIASVHGWAYSMRAHRLFPPKYGLGKNRSGMPEPNPMYTSPITSLDVRRTFQELTGVVV